MSIDVTIRQKMVRVCASAAICGLSVSFLLGEIVDQSAAKLRSWKPDPRLIPAEYSFLKPIQSGALLVNAKKWEEKLLAYNEGAQIDEIEIKTVQAAPLESHRAEVTQKESDLSNEEVEAILISIHEATRELAAVQKPPQDGLKDVVLASVKKLPAETTEAHRDRKAEAEDEAEVWIISGRILTATSNIGRGHFEVGLYSKINPEGQPIGFPLVQQILPAGKLDFRLSIPARIQQGFLFAEYVSAKGRVRSWIPAPVNPVVHNRKGVFAELTHTQDDTVASVSSSIKAETMRIRGIVTTMFVRGEAIPQNDVVVKLRGRKEASRTNSAGEFSLDIPSVRGTIFLEFLKAGYHPMIVAVPANSKADVRVELASKDAIEKIALNLGIRQSSSKGVFIGKISGPQGTSLKDASVELSLKADGPYFFSEDGFPTTDLRATSTDGRFIFLNVDSGAGFVEVHANGEALAPFQISFVEGGEMVFKSIIPTTGRIKGRLFNPIATSTGLVPVSGARVRVEGGSESAISDSYGAFSLGPIRFVKDETIALEISAEKFYNHKFQMRSTESLFEKETHLYVFPAEYVNKLATSMDIALDPYSGIIFGKVAGPSVRIDALSDHATNNSARDFYFDKKGNLLGSHQMTDPRFGTYVVFNVPRGRAILNGNDAGGTLRYSESASLSASTINVVMD